MSDVDRLLAAFGSGSLLRPTPDFPNIVDLSRSLALLAGADELEPTPGSNTLAELIGPSDHLVFVLADGLGMDLVEHLPASSFLARHLVTELRTVFPSATAAALTSIATGEWPSRHGVTGWWTHLTEIGAAAVILHFITRSDGIPLSQYGVTPAQAFPLPPLVRKVKSDFLALFPKRIADSVYSVYLTGNRARRGYGSLREAVDILVARVRDASRPTYTFLYNDRIDGAAHTHGTGHQAVRAALHELERELERLREGLAGRGRIVLSGDHGFLDAPEGARHLVKASDPLVRSLRFPPSGDTRAMYLHARDGAEEEIRQRFRDRFGDGFLLITVQEAEDLELFGPALLSPTTRDRLGDLIAISAGPDVIAYQPPGGTSRILSQASQHSGLSSQEMRIPLVVS